MKTIRRALLVLVLLLVVGVVGVFLYLDRIVKRAVETQATQSLNLQTTLSSASLSLFGGKLKLSDLNVASPPGFAAPQMLSLGATDVAVSYGQLRGDPVRVSNITLDKPTLVIENVNGSFNFKAAADRMPNGDSPAPSAPADSKPLKLIVEDLTVKDAKVVLRPGLPGLPSEINIPVATFSMKNVGTGDGSQNGAAMKDVVMQVITALAANASSSDAIPAPLRALLQGNVTAVMGQLGAEAQKRLMQAIPGELGKTLSGALADPGALVKDPGKLLGGLNPTSNPAGGLDSGKAGDALQGLLGGKSDKKHKDK